ncbi:MAG: hypothetical protein LBB74_03955 [Chitinispirillales bacterium]|jgi:hypothetical protein|nr:hypothetical protein [Chitinispirillales bacterium]
MGDSINIPGKKQICVLSEQNYPQLQIDGKKIFDRYDLVSHNIDRCIDPRYRDFLAEPVVKDDSIAFYAKTPKEEKRRFSELQGEELEKYAKIKEDTLAHYNEKISSLRDSGKGDTADYLSKAIERINDDDLYCYDGKVVLGVWGGSRAK